MQPRTRRYRGFEPWEISQLPNEFVLLEHAEAAASKWILRSQAVDSSAYDLVDLARLDDNLEAQLDALNVSLRHGSQIGVELCTEQLSHLGGRGEAFVAMFMAARLAHEPTLSLLLSSLDESPELAPAMASALGWSEEPGAVERVWPVIEAMWNSGLDNRRWIALAALEFHRRDPRAMLDEATTAKDTRLRARAARSIGELGLVARADALRRLLFDEDLEVRFMAARSLLLLGARDDEVSNVLSRQAEADEPRGRAAASLIMRAMPEASARAWYQHLLALGLPRSALAGAGAHGAPSFVPDLIEHMANDAIAIEAGLAFVAITGVDLEREDLERDLLPSDDEDDELDRPEGPVPNPDLVRDWWTKIEPNFATDHRYLAGLPIAVDNLQRVLRTARQPQRQAAAIELAFKHPGAPLYRTRQSGTAQARELLGWT